MIGRPTRVGQLPRVRIKDNPDLQRLLDALIETAEVREGRRGDELDKAVTFRELLGTGAFKLRKAGGVGFDTGIIPPGGPPEMYIPPVPQNVVAIALIGGVFLEWDAPQEQYSNHAYAEIWRGTDNNLGDAVMVGQTGTMIYIDMIDNPGQEYCYWVRFVSKQNVQGPFHSALGTCVVPAYDPNYLLALLDGELSDDQFTDGLRDRIDLIDGPNTMPGSVAAQVKTSRDALQAEIDTINATLSDIAATPAFDEDVAYVEGDLVTYDGGLYRCILDTTVPSPLPTNDTYWDKIGDYASLGDAVSGMAAELSDLTTAVDVIDGQLTATTTKSNALATKVMGTTSFEGLTLATVSSGVLFEERQARSTADTAEVSARQALSTKVTGAVDPASLTLATLSSGLLFDERVARSTADSSQVTRIDGLEASVNNPTTGLTSRALSTTVTDLITTEQNARASDVQQLEAQIGDNVAAISTKAETSVVTALDGRVESIEAEWSVKTDVNGHVAGIGLMNDGATSKFSVVADQFVIAPTAKDPVAGAPFYVLTTTKTIDGVSLPPGTYLRTAFIGDATIGSAKIASLAVTEAKIANASISNAKIADLAVTAAKIANATITDAKIANAAITNAKIANAAITSAKIGSVIQSATFNANKGWRIEQSGDAEFRGVVLSRPNVVATGTWVNPSSGSTNKATRHFCDQCTLIGSDEWATYAWGPASVTIFNVDSGYDDFADVQQTDRAAFVVKAVISATRMWWTTDPGSNKAYDVSVASEAFSQVAHFKVGASNVVPGGRIVMNFEVPLPRNIRAGINTIRVDQIRWSLIRVN
jgi:hypothetical protein